MAKKRIITAKDVVNTTKSKAEKQRDELMALSAMHPGDMTEKQIKAFEALRQKYK